MIDNAQHAQLSDRILEHVDCLYVWDDINPRVRLNVAELNQKKKKSMHSTKGFI